MFGLSTVKLIAAGVGLLAVAAFVALAFHWKSEMTWRGQQLSTICGAARAAADNPKLDCGQVPQQIAALGQDIAGLKSAVADQNAAIATLTDQTKQQQQKAAQASQDAAQRAKQASAASDSLSASARAPARSSAPCEASDELKKGWPS